MATTATAADAAGPAILIPVGSSGEVLQLTANELPAAPAELLEVFTAASVPLRFWLDVAVLYYRQQNYAAFEQILQRIFQPDIRDKVEYRDIESTTARLRALIAWSSFSLIHGNSAPQSAVRGSTADAAMSRYNDAMTNINAAETLAKLTGGTLASLVKTARAVALLYRICNSAADETTALMPLLSSAVAEAESDARTDSHALTRLWNEHSRSSVTGAVSFAPLLLCRAALAVSQKNYVEGRALYARVIRECVHVSAAVRVGLGVCLYHLGHRDAAVAAFKRAIALDPHCTAAVACLSTAELMAVVEEKTADGQQLRRNQAFGKIVDRLRKLTAPSPLALLNLSHATFFHWTPLINPASGAHVTVLVMRGSRRVVFSEDVTNRLRPGETLRIAANVAAGEGSAQTTLLVPARLVAVEHVAMVPASALPAQFNVGSSSNLLCVGRLRSPWGLATISSTAAAGGVAGGAPVLVLDLERVKRLCKSAFDASRNVSLKAEALYSLGRAMQAGGQYVDAQTQYRRCLELSSNFIPAMFAYAQTCIFQRKWDEAVSQLEKVLSLRTDDRSACKTLASLYLHQGRVEDSLSMARRAHEAAPRDITASALYAQLLARQDTPSALQKALKCTEFTIDSLRRTGCAVPASLINNCGVIAMRLAAHEPNSDKRRALFGAADEHFERANLHVAAELFPGFTTPAALKTPEVRDATAFSAAGVTITFNVARLLESLGNISDAEALHGKIIERLPAYFDSHLRLGLLCKRRGENSEAIAAFQKAIEAAQNFTKSSSSAAAVSHAKSAIATAHVLIGQTREVLGDVSSAKSEYTIAHKDADPYASLCLANAMFKDVYTADDAARETVLRDCFNMYKDVLKRQPQNVYAANGLGMVLAEQGRLEAAQAAFKAVRETAQNAVPVATNLAHVSLALGEGDAAIQLYAVATREATQSTPFLYQARAYMDTKEFQSAINVLQRAVLLAPSDAHVRYVLAYAQAEEALKIISTEVSKRTAEQVQHAVALVKAARAGFAWLKAGCEDPSSALRTSLTTAGVPLDRIPTFLSHLDRTLPIAETHLVEQRRRAVATQAESAHLKAQLEARAAQRREAEQVAAEAAKEARKNAQSAAKALQERLAEQAANTTSKDDLAGKENVKTMKSRAKKRARLEERRGDDANNSSSDDDSSDSDSSSGSSSSGGTKSSVSTPIENNDADAAADLEELFGEVPPEVEESNTQRQHKEAAPAAHTGDEGGVENNNNNNNDDDKHNDNDADDLFGDDLDGLEPANPKPRMPRYTSDSEGSVASAAQVSGRKRKAAVIADDDE